jgi:DUF1680 family protein
VSLLLQLLAGVLVAALLITHQHTGLAALGRVVAGLADHSEETTQWIMGGEPGKQEEGGLGQKPRAGRAAWSLSSEVL